MRKIGIAVLLHIFSTPKLDVIATGDSSTTVSASYLFFVKSSDLEDGQRVGETHKVSSPVLTIDHSFFPWPQKYLKGSMVKKRLKTTELKSSFYIPVFF